MAPRGSMAAPSRDELVKLGRELIAHLDEDGSRTISVRGERMTNHAQLPTVHGFARHTMRLGGVVLDLYERGLTLEAMPLVRSAYELAVTAQWAADSREGISAIYNEEMRHRRNLADTMEKSASEAFREFASVLRPDEADRIETVAGAQGKYFEQRCLALTPGGWDAYVIYRSMSAYCHPSAMLADHYLSPDDSEAGAKLMLEPEQFEHSTWLVLTLASMLWAASAVDVMDRDRPNRNYLRRVARKLDMPDVLRLTPAAAQAERDAAQRRRRAAWKGPKSRPRRAGTLRLPSSKDSKE